MHIKKSSREVRIAMESLEDHSILHQKYQKEAAAAAPAEEAPLPIQTDRRD